MIKMQIRMRPNDCENNGGVGPVGWRNSLREPYTSFAEFKTYSETYGIAERLGFKSHEDAWAKNPVIEGCIAGGDLYIVPDNIVTILHAINPTFGHGEDPRWPIGYERVAEICTDSLSDKADNCILSFGYEKTNHIDNDWQCNPEIVDIFQDEARSTSVGDVIVLPNGRIMRVESSGWKELEKD